MKALDWLYTRAFACCGCSLIVVIVFHYVCRFIVWFGSL